MYGDAQRAQSAPDSAIVVGRMVSIRSHFGVHIWEDLFGVVLLSDFGIFAVIINVPELLMLIVCVSVQHFASRELGGLSFEVSVKCPYVTFIGCKFTPYSQIHDHIGVQVIR